MPAYKEKNGTWTIQCYFADWTGQRKKKKKRGFRTKRDAQEWERDFLAKGSSDIFMSMSAFFEIYFDDAKQHLRPSTLRNRRLSLETHMLPYFGQRPLNAITPADIRSWQNHLLNHGLSPSYAKQISDRLSIIFNFAVRYYGLSDNPCKKAGTVKKPAKNEMQIWTPDEYRAFRETVKDRPELYISYQLLFYTGMRVGELLALTIGDFDPKNSTVSVNKTTLFINGAETVTPPKTPKGKRTITLPPFLVCELSEFILHMYYKPNPEYNIVPVSRSTLKKYIDRNSSLAGVPRIRVHDLRHSHASLLIHQGISPVAIADRLGHENATITLSVYSHMYPSDRNAIAAGLEAFK